MKNTSVIKENKVFLNLYKRGKFVAGRAVTVYFRKNGKGIRRLGITTGKKVGNAVTRSRCRRIIRAAYRENEAELPLGMDYVIVAREACGGCKSTQISSFLKTRAIPEILKSVNKSNTKGNYNKNNTNS
ncbi:MAG: ribonuclease P protein component [Oscillospiraceae bacterium]|nr:ribonuclease P protein component [Oscillospiraceae bacterium]